MYCLVSGIAAGPTRVGPNRGSGSSFKALHSHRRDGRASGGQDFRSGHICTISTRIVTECRNSDASPLPCIRPHFVQTRPVKQQPQRFLWFCQDGSAISTRPDHAVHGSQKYLSVGLGRRRPTILRLSLQAAAASFSHREHRIARLPN